MNDSTTKSSKKKVLVLASTFPRWDNDTTPPFVLELEKRLTNDFSIFVLAPHFKGAKKYEKKHGLEIHRFQYAWPENIQTLCYEGGILPNIKRNKLLLMEAFTLLFFELIAAIKIIRKEKIDLIHAHWIIPQGIIALILKKIVGISYIVTTHGGDIYGLQNSFLLQIKKTVLQNAKKITVVSNAIKKEVLKLDSKLPVEVISMGVDSQLFHPDKYNEKIKNKFNIKGPLLLFVGRLAEKKGVSYLLHAMPEIIKEFSNVTLLIIGEGTLFTQLKNLSKDLGLDKHVFFLGPVANNELPQYFATADIFIGPSIQTKDGDTEGLGLTFVEASFSGAIPIGTDIGGISDVIENGKTGFLIDQKNSQAIAKTVTKILNSKKDIDKMKDFARERAFEKFDWLRVSENYKKIYLKV